MSEEFDLQEKFPDLRPIKSPPDLSTINGCGFSIYGSRDFDADTGTFVKTYCFCIVFFPIIALSAYRVANANQGWYFIGKVPLSAFAKAWNLFFCVAILSVGGGLYWNHHVNSPEYLAAEKMEEGDRLAEAGEVDKAAQLYRDVSLSRTEHEGIAWGRLKVLLQGPVKTCPAKQAAIVLACAADVHKQRQAFPEVYACGMEVVNQHRENDPSGALAVHDAVAAAAPKGADVLIVSRQLLERVVVIEPENVELASRLALVYEELQELPKCEALLTPHIAQLGVSEGARILGHIFSEQGNYEQAHRLLVPYVEGRLKALHAAEKAHDDAQNNAYEAIFNELKANKGPADFYARHKSASPEQQAVMVNEYIEPRIKDDPNILATRETLIREAKVVPVALDLGMVLLRRGQSLTDPAARKAELEKAEKTFLAVRGLAGESDAFRLSLGQVYYWLGKHKEGRQLFDELLIAKQRNFETLMGVSLLLREVGATSEARSMAEEAYNKETDQQKKYAAAAHRSVMKLDLDDEIAWLGRSNPAETEIKASLSASEGQRAQMKGKDEEAATHFRQAIESYATMTPSSTTLNNAALSSYNLFTVTGERSALEKCSAMMEKAVALAPSNSILLRNAADFIVRDAMTDIIGNEIDLGTLRNAGRLDLLRYLYRDQAGREIFVQRVRKHAGIKKAIGFYEKLLLLAPKNANTYASLASIYRFTRDLDALRSLHSRLETVDLDLADSMRHTLDGYAGKNDEKTRQQLTDALNRAEKMVKKTRAKGGPTFAVAVIDLLHLKLGLAALDQKVDLDEMLALAMEAQKAAPSSATLHTVGSILYTRAERTLSKNIPAYKAFAAKGKDSLDPSMRIAIALMRGGALRTAVRENKDVQKAIPLVLQSVKAFPKTTDAWDWAMLLNIHPKEAEKVADASRADEIDRLHRSIMLKLSPLNAAVALHEAWALQIDGKEAEGKAILKELQAKGVPLP